MKMFGGASDRVPTVEFLAVQAELGLVDLVQRGDVLGRVLVQGGLVAALERIRR